MLGKLMYQGPFHIKVLTCFLNQMIMCYKAKAKIFLHKNQYVENVAGQIVARVLLAFHGFMEFSPVYMSDQQGPFVTVISSITKCLAYTEMFSSNQITR